MYGGPGPGAWGDDATNAMPSGSPNAGTATAAGGAGGVDYYTQTLTTFNPLITAAVASATDPVKQAAILRVKLTQARARGASKYEIDTIVAKLVAADHAAAMKIEGEQSGREWRNLGKIAAVAGTAVAVVGTFSILALTLNAILRRR